MIARKLAALLAVLVMVALVNAPAAHAISWYCQDQVQPVRISTQRLNSTTVRVGTYAPLNGTAYFYASDNGANSHAAFFVTHVQPSAWTYHDQSPDTLPHHYWIAHVGDSGQVWYGASGQTLGSCHSPIVSQS